MEMPVHPDSEKIICADCLTGKVKSIDIEHGFVRSVTEVNLVPAGLPFMGPGLIDLQINGVNGIDFNSTSLTADDILHATMYLLAKGITSYLPTVITNSTENIIGILKTFDRACGAHEIVGECIEGIHLEGPFISPVNGAVGAHDKKYVRAPDWQLFERFQEASGNRIKLITLAPEWEGAMEFIKECVRHKVVVAIGHSMASSEQVTMAAEAGASLSTHLGNGVPLQLPRHPNILWDQLAEGRLYASLIADGIHIPDSFIRVAMLAKAGKLILASDATCFAGMPAGEYSSHIGNTVILDKDRRISVKGLNGVLAGAAKLLMENIEHMVGSDLVSLAGAWTFASENPAILLGKDLLAFQKDMVIFRLKENIIVVEQVIKNNRVVFKA